MTLEAFSNSSTTRRGSFRLGRGQCTDMERLLDDEDSEHEPFDSAPCLITDEGNVEKLVRRGSFRFLHRRAVSEQCEEEKTGQVLHRDSCRINRSLLGKEVDCDENEDAIIGPPAETHVGRRISLNMSSFLTDSSALTFIGPSDSAENQDQNPSIFGRRSSFRLNRLASLDTGSLLGKNIISDENEQDNAVLASKDSSRGSRTRRASLNMSSALGESSSSTPRGPLENAGGRDQSPRIAVRRGSIRLNRRASLDTPLDTETLLGKECGSDGSEDDNLITPRDDLPRLISTRRRRMSLDMSSFLPEPPQPARTFSPVKEAELIAKEASSSTSPSQRQDERQTKSLDGNKHQRGERKLRRAQSQDIGGGGVSSRRPSKATRENGEADVSQSGATASPTKPASYPGSSRKDRMQLVKEAVNSHVSHRTQQGVRRTKSQCGFKSQRPERELRRVKSHDAGSDDATPQPSRNTEIRDKAEADESLFTLNVSRSSGDSRREKRRPPKNSSGGSNGTGISQTGTSLTSSHERAKRTTNSSRETPSTKDCTASSSQRRQTKRHSVTTCVRSKERGSSSSKAENSHSKPSRNADCSSSLSSLSSASSRSAGRSHSTSRSDSCSRKSFLATASTDLQHSRQSNLGYLPTTLHTRDEESDDFDDHSECSSSLQLNIQNPTLVGHYVAAAVSMDRESMRDFVGTSISLSPPSDDEDLSDDEAFNEDILQGPEIESFSVETGATTRGSIAMNSVFGQLGFRRRVESELVR